jgi:DNA-directed RNA polymerase sigma subunit (sigma70/sigma32)
VDTSARARLIARHTPFVHKLVGDYLHIGLSPDDLDDLGQEGLVGLIEAVDDFDPAILPPSCFASYARHRILRRIRDHLATILEVRDHEETVGLHSPIEAWVVIGSAGMDGRRPRSILRLSLHCGLSTKRIRQIRDRAYQRMAERLFPRRRA